LSGERAIDDARAAAAMARSEALGRHRGRHRVLRRLEAAGIPSAVAGRAVQDLFADIDGDDLLETALSTRLRGGLIRDQAHTARLYRYLVAQGFDPDRVFKALKARSVK
jgi:SOS response regulatory protein OraA/RecX